MKTAREHERHSTAPLVSLPRPKQRAVPGGPVELTDGPHGVTRRQVAAVQRPDTPRPDERANLARTDSCRGGNFRDRKHVGQAVRQHGEG